MGDAWGRGRRNLECGTDERGAVGQAWEELALQLREGRSWRDPRRRIQMLVLGDVVRVLGKLLDPGELLGVSFRREEGGLLLASKCCSLCRRNPLLIRTCGVFQDAPALSARQAKLDSQPTGPSDPGKAPSSPRKSPTDLLTTPSATSALGTSALEVYGPKSTRGPSCLR